MLLLAGCAQPDFYIDGIGVLVEDGVRVDRTELTLGVRLSTSRALEISRIDERRLQRVYDHTYIEVVKNVGCSAETCGEYDGQTLRIELQDTCPHSYMIVHELGHLYAQHFFDDVDSNHTNDAVFRDYNMPLYPDGSYEADAELDFIAECP